MSEEKPASGRSTSFAEGAQFFSLQQGAGRAGFTPNSTLEQNQILTNPNGMSKSDRDRAPLGGPGRSLNGQSDKTFQSRLWLGSAPRTYGG